MPLLAILIVTAPELIPMVFGDAWRAAIEPTQVLAVAGMIAAILTGYPQVMLAAGRPRPLLVFNVWVLVVYAVAVFLTAKQGLATVALAVVGIHIAMLAAVYLILFRRVLGMPVGRLFTDLAPAVATAALVLMVGLPVADLMRERGRLPGPDRSPRRHRRLLRAGCSPSGRCSRRSGETSPACSAASCRAAPRKVPPPPER